MEKIKDTTNLKSGYYENPENPPLPCQYDTECLEVANWKSEKNSVCFIRMKFDYQDITYNSSGTGFFLNKQGGYSDTDYPIIASCGHIFAPKVATNTYYDISNSYYDFIVVIDYEQETCKDTKVMYGKRLSGSVNRIGLGLTYNPRNLDYSEDGDYSIFQTTKNVDKLSKYNILYAGWDANPNYLEEGYAAIGHPKSSVKKINVENSRAWANSNNFGLYFDKGVNEPGCSGSPVFNSSKNVVGWICAGNGDCLTVGQDNLANHTTCGRFDDLHLNLLYLIDPNLQYESASSNPQPPSYSELPSHCKNCIQDEDETDIDCGGEDCYPCGMQDVLTVKTDLDILGTVKSRYEIFAEPDPGNLLALKSGNSSLEAGMNIYLNGGFEVQKGATFYAGIDAELMTEADRGCQPECVAASMPYFSPNGDGDRDYFYIRQAFVVSYNISVYNRWDQLEYSKTNIPVFSNGYLAVWDGTGASSTGNKTIFIDAKDCNGTVTTYVFYTYLLNTKSVTIPKENSNEKDVELDNVDKKLLLEVYPNPFSGNISIQYSGNVFPLKYKIIDLNGKEIIVNETNNANEQIDLNGVSPGTYIINAKAGDCNLTCKLIKK